MLSIRPEAIELGVGGDNSVAGTILSHVYAGRYARFQVKLFGDGDTVPVNFAPDKIWVLEANSTELPVSADAAG